MYLGDKDHYFPPSLTNKSLEHVIQLYQENGGDFQYQIEENHGHSISEKELDLL